MQSVEADPMPMVSIVLPVFNGERFLREAMDSLLRQSFTDFELIVIDDGSHDGTLPILRTYNDARLRVLINRANCGIVETLNKGIAHAQGTYICRMDADDVALPDRVRMQVEYLEAHPSIALVGSNVILIDEGGNELGTEAYPETDVAIRDVLFIHNPFAHGAVMMRKSVLDTVGVYDKRFVHNEDYDLWLRIAARHSVTNLPLPLLKRRVHDASITRSQELALARARIRTLAHAAVTYFQNPLRFLYLARPIGAYLYRLVKSVV